eukprot:m.160899 g.160899  ORF g.160899 m.160899 type:complete len:557 (+) comp14353_c0_seq3:1444-3114(+)
MDTSQDPVEVLTHQQDEAAFFVERTSGFDLLQLPDEMLLHIFQFLPTKDISSIAQTCHRFYALSRSPFIQSKICFHDHWPTQDSLPAFEHASQCGNFGASVRLALALLYGEGDIKSNPSEACKMLVHLESFNPYTPFVWLLVRPPWSTNTCTKAQISENFRLIAEETDNAYLRSHLQFSAAKCLQLQDPPQPTKAGELMERSLDDGCASAAVALTAQLDPRDSIAVLERCSGGHTPISKLQLAIAYAAAGRIRGDSSIANALIKECVAEDVHENFSVPQQLDQPDLDTNGKMRYILVDWLIEVADLKRFSRNTLATAITLVDRYLHKWTVSRKTLQLLGITCMLVAARFLEEDIVTIREASWLTDNTYSYDSIVRAIARVVHCTGGDIQKPGAHTFLDLFVEVMQPPPDIELYAYYLLENILLNVDTQLFPASHFAACALFLTYQSHGYQVSWPVRLQQKTGLDSTDFLPCMKVTAEFTFKRDHVTDHRGVVLSAIQERFQRIGQHQGTEVQLRLIPMEVDDIVRSAMDCSSQADSDRDFTPFPPEFPYQSQSLNK